MRCFDVTGSIDNSRLRPVKAYFKQRPHAFALNNVLAKTMSVEKTEDILFLRPLTMAA